jgi:hypothetical protein
VETLNRYLILMANTWVSFSGSYHVLAATVSNLTIELVPLILVPGDK